jgi:hypothetical protein
MPSPVIKNIVIEFCVAKVSLDGKIVIFFHEVFTTYKTATNNSGAKI